MKKKASEVDPLISKPFDPSNPLLKLTDAQKATYTEYESELKQLQQEQDLALKNINQILRETDKQNGLVDQLNGVKKEIQGLFKKREECINGGSASDCQDVQSKTGSFKRQLEFLRGKRDGLKEQLDKRKASYEKAVIEFEKAQTNAMNLAGTIQQRSIEDAFIKRAIAERKTEIEKEQRERLRASIRNLNVRQAFFETYDRLENVDEKLDILEDELDNSDIGVYLQDKLGRILASDLFCKVATKCEGISNPTDIKPGDMWDVFKSNAADESDPKRSRSSYRKDRLSK